MHHDPLPSAGSLAFIISTGACLAECSISALLTTLRVKHEFSPLRPHSTARPSLIITLSNEHLGQALATWPDIPILLISATAPEQMMPSVVHVSTQVPPAQLYLAIKEAAPSVVKVPVRLTKRETEVLGTYVLGATLQTTCRTHWVAEGTVREHYRRVSGRYNDSGRQVRNKTQLLLAMVADGWITIGDTTTWVGCEDD